jgi:hypothetical protein
MNPETKTADDEVKENGQIYKDFRYDLVAHDDYIKDFDAYESMLLSKPYDSVSKKVQNGLSDGRTTTIYQERAARVVGQLPTGQMKAYGKKDTGVAQVLDLIRMNYMYPNASSQAPMLQKVRNWQFNSSVYGFMPMFYDWNINDKTGYVGPDCWLWHPRNFIPQIGRTSIDDMDYCHSIVYMGEEALEALLDQPDSAGWDKKVIQDLIDGLGENLNALDTRRTSFITRTRQSQAEKGRRMIATRYEAGEDGHWVVFCPENPDSVLRDIPNPHKTGRIPFIITYATPIFDNFYGLGDFQRAKPLQFASDGLDNFYFAGIKRGLYPPTIVNGAQVVKSTLTQNPGAIWVENVTGAIREYNTNPTGLNTYQNAKTIMNGAMLNQAGTSDTSQNSAGTNDPGFGKTPDAVAALKQRESTRDNQDRFYLESALEQLINQMMGLFGTIGTENIPLNVYSEDLEEIIQAGYITTDDNGQLAGELSKYIDISESGQSAKMMIPPELFKDIESRFHLDQNSTAQQDKTAQLASLKSYMELMASTQNNIQDLQSQGKTFDFGLASEMFGSLSDVPNMNKLIRPMTQQEAQAYQQSQSPPPVAEKAPIDKVQLDALYKVVPPDIQRQIETMLGFKPSDDGMTMDQQLKTVDQGIDMHSAVQQGTQAEHQTQIDQQNNPQPNVQYGMHNGTPIADPDIAQAHFALGSMAQAIPPTAPQQTQGVAPNGQ